MVLVLTAMLGDVEVTKLPPTDEVIVTAEPAVTPVKTDV